MGVIGCGGVWVVGLSGLWVCPGCGGVRVVGMSRLWGCPGCGDVQVVGVSGLWGCLGNRYVRGHLAVDIRLTALIAMNNKKYICIGGGVFLKKNVLGSGVRASVTKRGKGWGLHKVKQ